MPRGHVVEEHAAFVRDLFRRYLEIGSVVRLKAALDQENVRLPTRTDGRGKTTGGGLISRGHLYKILSNPIYVGLLTHEDQVHEGLHDPIVDHESWNRVQRLLAEHAQDRAGSRADSDALLAGKLFDDRGNRMSPSHATKRGCRYRDYARRRSSRVARRMRVRRPRPSKGARTTGRRSGARRRAHGSSRAFDRNADHPSRV